MSYVIQQAGYTVPTSVSGNVQSWHFPAGPGRVTIFYNGTHTFMRIGNRYFGTSTAGRPGGGAGWIATSTLPESFLASFREVHVPQLGDDAFAPATHHRHHGHAHGPAPRPARRRTRHATHPAPLRLTPLPAWSAPQMQLTFPIS